MDILSLLYMKITSLKLRKIEETLKDFKCLLVRYREVMGNKELLREFCSRNRNPLWDITSIKYFNTGLKSKGLIEEGGNGVSDHYIQRMMSTEIIFRELNNNPDMSVSDFILLVKKYSSTVSITKEEHKKITILTKGKDVMNYVMYEKAGIEVPGLMDYIL